MVSYLLLVVLGIGMIVIGMAHGVTQDIVDIIIPLYSTVLPGQTDTVADDGFNTILSIFNSLLILIGLGILFFVFVMSQKPVRSY